MQAIAHNLLSQFTDRQLNISTDSKAKAAEKLSSGYRINRAADDAAGLKISEKMRWQIRGLDKGMRNITEGISLIKTADGALSEVHDILQRVRELSIQAYNDTNTEGDRDAIQMEVSAIINEIDRIADTTTFNNRKVLKGNPLVGVQISGPQVVDKIVTKRLAKEIPSWLKVDSELKAGNNTGIPQEYTDGVMLIWDGKDTSDKKYYGPKNANVPPGYIWQGEWSPKIDDNPSAKIDFEGLLNVNDAVDLYTKVYGLIGTKISFPCGTCSSQVNSVSFGGHEKSIITTGFENAAAVDVGGNINLSDKTFNYQGIDMSYYDAIQQLVETYSSNHDTGGTPGANGESAAAKDLAKQIALDLKNKAKGVLENCMANHFDRVMDGPGDYSLIVYDYRDDSALTNMHAADASIKTNSVATYQIITQEVIDGVTEIREEPLNIMCSAQMWDSIDIDLPYLSRSKLHLQPYLLNRYTDETVYSDSYKNKLLLWEQNATEVIHTGSYTMDVITTTKPAVYGYKYVNGERQQFTIQAAEVSISQKTINYTYTEKIYGPKPAAEPGDITIKKKYTPDPVELVDDAISIVSDMRARLGATQNRLEHAYAANANTSENSQAAESRIRDADMAEELIEYSKHSILEQAGQAVLAQAEQITKGVLTLLQ